MLERVLSGRQVAEKAPMELLMQNRGITLSEAANPLSLHYSSLFFKKSDK